MGWGIERRVRTKGADFSLVSRIILEIKHKIRRGRDGLGSGIGGAGFHGSKGEGIIKASTTSARLQVEMRSKVKDEGIQRRVRKISIMYMLPVSQIVIAK